MYRESLCNWSKNISNFGNNSQLSQINPEMIRKNNYKGSISNLPYSKYSTCYRENSVLMNDGHYILKLILDVDYFRTQEICQIDDDLYTCISSPDSHFKDVIIAGTINRKLKIFNVVKGKSINTDSSFNQVHNIESTPTFIFQNKQLIYMGCSDSSI